MGFEIQNYRELTQIETRQDQALGIMKWGTNNAFPQTLKNLIDQSSVAKPAIDRVIKFYKGGKFEGEDTIISSSGLTLKGLVAILADDYATFNAYSIHSNFDIEGTVSSIEPLRITDLRFNEFDELNTSSKLGYHPDFGLNSVVKKTITQTVTKAKIKWIDKFNPDSVLKQIENTKKGISNYNGQVLYHSEAGSSSYPIPTLQAQINYMLSDIENSILVRKETATGFINSYLLKTMLASEDPNLKALESAIAQAQGARGSGKIITLSGLSPDEVNNSLLEEIGSGGSGAAAIIESCTKTYELAHKVINGAYLIPPILSGADQKTGFSSADLKEAYFVFNSITQTGRDTIESGVNRVLEQGDFGIKSIKLQRLTLDEEVPVATEPTTKKSRLTNLVMGGPGSGPNPGGGSSDESSNSVSQSDYDEAAQNENYTTFKSGTPDEKTIISFTERGFDVNYAIREGSTNSVDEKYISNLNNSLSKLPSDQGNILYRGVNMPSSDLELIHPGEELNFKGFTSTTKDRTRVERFNSKNQKPGDSSVVFKIEGHKNGKDISKISGMTHEQEVLFKTNTSWEIVSKNGNEITIKEK